MTATETPVQTEVAAIPTPVAPVAATPPTPVAPVLPTPAQVAATPAAPAAPVAAKIEPYAITPPEGFAPNKAVLDAYAKTSLEQGLTQKQAQALYEAQVKSINDSSTAVGEQWIAELKAHPTLGGTKLDVSLSNADQALARFATPAFAELARAHNLHRNPGMVEMLNAFHAAVSPDSKFLQGSAPQVSRSPDQIADTFFKNMPKA